MDHVVNYLSDSLPAMKASDFLALVDQIKRVCDASEGLKEERKEQLDFEWLFGAAPKFVPKTSMAKFDEMDAKLVKMESEWAVIESWFPGKKIKLEKVFRASEDGFTGTAYHAKCNN